MDTGKDGLSLTAGVMLYVHLECLAPFLARIERARATVQPDRLRFWKPEELIGRYRTSPTVISVGTTLRRPTVGISVVGS